MKHLPKHIKISSERVTRISQSEGPKFSAPSEVQQSVELIDELKGSFMSYAMSTILGRALPDARDGLKPVHRRVLYAMHVLNLTPESSYRKSARVVGEVLGKYHPHGDQSVYDALVRMAQDFVMLHPLVNGHGNFGSVDNDPPAAMRYTESKLSALAQSALLADLKENCVGYLPNFDGNEVEPIVLPARLPMLLINGASGIAVGMATNIPPHNLGEVVDAVVAMTHNPGLTDEVKYAIFNAHVRSDNALCYRSCSVLFLLQTSPREASSWVAQRQRTPCTKLDMAASSFAQSAMWR